MPSFDFNDPRLVLAGTVYGEARGGGMGGMADVASVVLNRAAAGWNGGTIMGVCLAPWQFSCWIGGSDPNRAAILTAASLNDAMWQRALAVADEATGGAPDQTGGADSYYAVSIHPPLWTRSPARHTTTRWQHSFWIVRPGRPVRVISTHATANERPAGKPMPVASQADALDDQYNPGA